MSLTSWCAIAKVYDPLKAGSIDGTDVEPHDRAVIRAMRAKYKTNKSVDGDPLKTIFVARLDRDTEEDTIWTAFRTFGKIQKCRLVRDIVTGFSKGYGFVEYEEEKSARNASTRGNRMVIDKAEVFVDMECGRTLPGWVPRRLGGGIGGNKKSGQLRFGGKDRPFIKPITEMTGRDNRRDNNEDIEKRPDRDQRDFRSESRRPKDSRDSQYDREGDRRRDWSERDERRSHDDRRRERRRDDDFRSNRSDRRSRYRSRSRERYRDREDDRHSDIEQKIAELRKIQQELAREKEKEKSSKCETSPVIMISSDSQFEGVASDSNINLVIKTEPNT